MSREAVLLMAAGRDRPGIVDRISGVLFEAGCNLEDSRMAILGGEFALIVLVTGTPGALADARLRLEEVAAELQLVLQVRPTELPATGADTLPYRVHAVALDHPGIVHRVTRLLAEHRVNVARVDTRVHPAPMSAAPLFSLEMEVQVPADQPIARLRAELRELAEASNIDIAIEPID